MRRILAAYKRRAENLFIYCGRALASVEVPSGPADGNKISSHDFLLRVEARPLDFGIGADQDSASRIRSASS
jgi:hypothetical protein